MMVTVAKHQKKHLWNSVTVECSADQQQNMKTYSDPGTLRCPSCP